MTWVDLPWGESWTEPPWTWWWWKLQIGEATCFRNGWTSGWRTGCNQEGEGPEEEEKDSSHIPQLWDLCLNSSCEECRQLGPCVAMQAARFSTLHVSPGNVWKSNSTPFLGFSEFLSGIHCCPKDRCRWCHRKGRKAHCADSARDVFEVPAGSEQWDGLLGVRDYKAKSVWWWGQTATGTSPFQKNAQKRLLFLVTYVWNCCSGR